MSATHAYIGRKPCGCVVAACIERPHLKHDLARFCAEAICHGLILERVSMEDVHLSLGHCDHGSPPKTEQPEHLWYIAFEITVYAVAHDEEEAIEAARYGLDHREGLDLDGLNWESVHTRASPVTSLDDIDREWLTAMPYVLPSIDPFDAPGLTCVEQFERQQSLTVDPNQGQLFVEEVPDV